MLISRGSGIVGSREGLAYIYETPLPVPEKIEVTKSTAGIPQLGFVKEFFSSVLL
jgi:hypothetical protein